MTDATEKQIKFAQSLGIPNPSNFTKEALSVLIKEKTGETSEQGDFGILKGSKSAYKPQPTQSVVVNKTEKPHSYEFGPANNRHKIYYNDIQELQAHIKSLNDAGFNECSNIPVEKV